MPLVVQKYGGSSLVDIASLKAVAGRVAETRRRGCELVVVVSAMGNTTNELLELARQVSRAPGRRELDMLVSVGERVAMALLAMAVRELGVPAVSLTGSQSGIVTDESHNNARIVSVRPHRVRAALDRGQVVIVAGFQGVSREREVTTLGRGGSDTTAVALAAALGADVCEILSDVDGLYSADPRLVPDAVRLELASLEEALALARSGARILKDEAVAWAAREGVELLLSSPAAASPGTRIQVPPLPSRVAAITTCAGQERFAFDDAVAAFRALSGAGAPLRVAFPGELLADLADWADRDAFVPPPGMRSLGRAALLSVAGGGAGADPDVIAAALDALRASQTPVLGWTSAAECLRIAVPEPLAPAATRALHDRLRPPRELAPAPGDLPARP